MASVTISIPQKTVNLMKRFPRMDWELFVKKRIIEQALALKKIKAIQEELKREKTFSDWAVRLQRASRQGRLEELKRDGSI